MSLRARGATGMFITVSVKITHLRRSWHVGWYAFGAPNQGLENSFSCRIVWPRITWFKQTFGRGDDSVGSPHGAQISQFELLELILLLILNKQFRVEQLEATVSQSTVPSTPLNVWSYQHIACWCNGGVYVADGRRTRHLTIRLDRTPLIQLNIFIWKC